MYTLQFDGLFRGVPGGDETTTKAGFMCFGWLISRKGVVIARGHGAFARGREASSNAAEYLALIEGLEALLDLGVKKEAVKVRGDAKCIIDQMRGTAAVNSPGLKPLYNQAQRLVMNFRKIYWSWTPRKDNKEADALTRRAMRQVRLDAHSYQLAVQAIDPRNYDRPVPSRLLPLIDLRVYQPVGMD